MPKMAVKEEFKLQTRDRFTTVDCELSMTIDGRELPSMAIIGEAIEKAMNEIQVSVTNSYTKVPERVG